MKDETVSVGHLEGLDWEFVVVDEPIVNAFCLPGGKIVVYTGLLKEFKSNAAIATVIGHEVVWGGISMIDAERRLLANALKDPDNQHFVLLSDRLGKELYFLQNAEGAGLAPFDCWVCLRGIKTMALCVEKQQENAQKIAEFLFSHPRVKKVHYAGLPSHPGYSLHYYQAKGAGSVLSFETGSVALSRYVTENTKYFSITVSFGSVKSLISMPCYMSHSVIPAAV